mgnify:CR=1 FL=1
MKSWALILKIGIKTLEIEYPVIEDLKIEDPKIEEFITEDLRILRP